MNLAVIGAGAISRRAHLPAWRSVEGVEIRGIADVNKDLAERVGEEFLIPRRATDYHELLADPELDVVDVCTSTPAHFEIVSACLKAGKHVLVEKPLTLCLADAVSLYQLAREVDRTVCVIQNYRYMDVVGQVRARLQGGFLGEVPMVHAHAHTRFPSSWTLSTWLYHERAVLYDFTPHLVDMVLYLHAQPVRRVQAVGQWCSTQAPFLTAAQILLEFADGSTASLDTSWVTSTFTFVLELHGSGGTAMIEPMREMYRESRGSVMPLDEVNDFLRKMRTIVRSVITRSHFTKPTEVYVQLFGEFAASVRDKTAAPVTMEEAVWNMAILEATWLSIKEGRPVLMEELWADHGMAAPPLEPSGQPLPAVGTR